MIAEGQRYALEMHLLLHVQYILITTAQKLLKYTFLRKSEWCKMQLTELHICDQTSSWDMVISGGRVKLLSINYWRVIGAYM